LDYPITCHWGTLSSSQKRQEILRVADAYCQSLRELTGRAVGLQFSCAERLNETEAALITFEVEL